MGTTINGVYEGGKRMRRVRALKRLENDLIYYDKIKKEAIQSPKNPLQRAFAPNLTEDMVNERSNKQIERINKEIAILKSRI
jgi:hypothetical protein